MSYICYDKLSKGPERHAHGHFTVYKTERAARRRANYLNNATHPKLDRWTVAAAQVEVATIGPHVTNWHQRIRI